MWANVGAFTLSKSWLFTPAVTGTWFRLQHNQPPLNRRGLIAQASAFAPVQLHGIKRVWAKQQYDVYQFPQPDCWTDRVIALRGVSYDVENANDWIVTLDVWDSDTPTTIPALAEQIAELKALIELLI
jgi:hypothetical protein